MVKHKGIPNVLVYDIDNLMSWKMTNENPDLRDETLSTVYFSANGINKVKFKELGIEGPAKEIEIVYSVDPYQHPWSYSVFLSAALNYDCFASSKTVLFIDKKGKLNGEDFMQYVESFIESIRETVFQNSQTLEVDKNSPVCGIQKIRINAFNDNYIDIEKDKIDEFYKENFKEKFSSANCTKATDKSTGEDIEIYNKPLVSILNFNNSAFYVMFNGGLKSEDFEFDKLRKNIVN